ncbi:MAG: hypothetical protein IAE84_13195 [Saprospiraceae bacterium]|nr:hypothetical protein [Saprospiraceae bacterium]
MVDFKPIYDAINVADYSTALKLLDQYFGDTPTTEYSQLKQTIKHFLFQGLMPPPAVQSGLLVLVNDLENLRKSRIIKDQSTPNNSRLQIKELGKPSRDMTEEDFDWIYIRQKVAELVEPYRKDWNPDLGDIVKVCVKFRCIDDFNYFKRLEGTISKELFQQKVKARIGQYKEEVQAAEKRHADREPRSPFERYWLQHEDGSLTLEQRPAKNPYTELTAFTRITNSVAMAFLEDVFIERSAREKAEKLVQQAESKAEKDFQRWATEYLPKRLKHRAEADKKQFLQARYRQIEDSFHKLPQPLLIDLPRKEILSWVTHFFIDLSDGLKPRFSPPEYFKNILADRLKANLCLEHIDKLLSQSPETLADPLTQQPALHVEAPSNPNVLYQEGLQRQMDTLIQKLNRIRLAYAIETDAGQKFKYEQDIKALEEDIAALKDR